MRFNISNYYPKASFYFCFAGIALFAACKKDVNSTQEPAKPLVLNFRTADSTLYDADDITTNIIGDSIKVTLPGTTDITNIISAINVDGATVLPKPGSHQDFTKPVDYKITTKDSVKIYHVSVHLNKLKNIIYFGGQDNNLYALNSKKGKLLWKYTSNDNLSYSEPILVDSTLYTINASGKLLAINPALGKLKWNFQSGGTSITTPAVVNGVVYFGSDDHLIYAVDAKTGLLKWTRQTYGNVDSSPAVVDGILYIGSSDFYIYAFDVNTGALKWKYNTGSGIVESSPVISNNVVFIGNRNGYLNAINTADGSLNWKYSADGISLEQARIVVQNNVVYFASWYSIDNFNKPGTLYAVNETDGTLVWKALESRGFTSGPTVANGKLYINSDDTNIYAIDVLTGKTIWGNPILANGAIPAVGDGNVYTGAGGTHLFYSLDATTGKTNWTFPLPNSLTTSKPCIIDANGNVIL
jgi:outer membrane protein assembly factor BamB